MRKNLAVLLGSILSLIVTSQPARAQTTAFTYQGRLTENGVPANGSNDLTFTLYNAASGGATVGSSNVVSDLAVSNGLFTVTLDFPGAFDGSARWLQIAVRPGASAGAYTNLTPRQPITATPYAITAGNLTGPVLASQMTGTLPSALLSGTYANAVILNNGTNSFSGNGAGLTNLNASRLASGTVADARLSANVALRSSSNAFTGNQTIAGSVVVDQASQNTGSVSSASLTFGASSGEGMASRRTSGANQFGLDLYTGFQSRMTLANSGNVGIGTLTPGAKLDVAGTSIRLLGPGGNGTQLAFDFATYDPATFGATSPPVRIQATDANFSGDLDFLTKVPGAATNALVSRLHLASATGNIGIGTTTPAQKLHIVGPENTAIDLVTGPLTLRSSVNSVAGAEVGTVSSHALTLLTGNLLRQIITADGKVGINKPNPATALDVNGTVTATGFSGSAGTPLILGTTDNQPLEFKVNNQRGLRLEPNPNSPNVIGGSAANEVTNGIYGAVIAGGGSSFYPNRVGAIFGTVVGGAGNTASGNFATAMGNFTTASGYAATAMGWYSEANGFGSLAAGSSAKANHDGSFVWGDKTPADFASTGNNQFLIRAEGGVGINKNDPATALDVNGIVTARSFDGTPGTTLTLGTTDNQPLEFKVYNQRALRLEPTGSNSVNVIGGWLGNGVAPGVVGATVAGGGAGDYFGFPFTNRVEGDFATVGGGDDNTSSGFTATVSGGRANTSSADFATVSGGSGNTSSGSYSMVGGGQSNTNSGYGATVGGGVFNTNSGFYATVGGGQGNISSGNSATVPGGNLNCARGFYSFAAGRRAKANHDGAFVWADSTDADIASTDAKSVTMRASGGYRLFSNSGATAGVSLAAAGTSWAVISDRNVKKDFAPVDQRTILEKLAAMSITQWHYQWESPDVTRHIGPMAQDFKAAFYPGADDKTITTQEADGVAFAAIQGLNQKVEAGSQTSGVRIEKLEAQNAELKRELAEIKQLLFQLADKRN